MQAKNIVVIGASTGIGSNLTKRLVQQGNRVWGVARRIDLLEDLSKSIGGPLPLKVSQADISKIPDLQALAREFAASGFVPDVVVINAGIYKQDMTDNIDPIVCEEILRVNFFGAINCVSALKPIMSKSGQFIAISSSSALKGSAFEGAGYAASKAALTVAFESFQMKWSKLGLVFTTIFYGPLDSSMRRTKGGSIFETSAEKAVQTILNAIDQRLPVYHQPAILFLLLRIAKILPSRLYLAFLTFAESRMNQDPR